jgi:hypothetical protein
MAFGQWIYGGAIFTQFEKKATRRQSTMIKTYGLLGYHGIT